MDEGAGEEYGDAGAIARWTDEGRTVTHVLATRGEAGIDGMTPEEAGPLREREQIASAAVVGVHDVAFLDHADGLIEYGLPLRGVAGSAVGRGGGLAAGDARRRHHSHDRPRRGLTARAPCLPRGPGDAAGDPDTFLREFAAETGKRFGGRLACAFELIPR